MNSPIGEYYQEVKSCIVYQVKSFASFQSDELGSAHCVVCESVSSNYTVVIPIKEFFNGQYQLVDPSTLSFNRSKSNV
jgi:hypothetical protein